MRYHLMTVACFCVAALLWLLGAQDNALLPLVLAGCVELIGWKRVLSRRKHSRPV